MKTIALVAPAMGLALAVMGCGASNPAAPPFVGAAGGVAPGAAAPTTFAEQVAAGQTLYGQNCASCHGAAGEGKKAPPVVGLSTGGLPLDPPAGAKYRKGQFLAFDLKANGIDLGDKKLDATIAKTLEIPRK